MKKIASMVTAGFLVMSGSIAYAGGDAAAGKTKYATCQGCHGPGGMSTNPLWPSLAGQKDGYLVKQMKAFRDGQRNDPMMAPMAKGLSDADIDNLAAYLSTAPCK